MNIVYTKVYFKKINKLLSEQERHIAEDEIASDPTAHPLLRGGSGIRKARARRSNVGKSGGIRIIYYFYVKNETIFMLTAYAKNDLENISEADKKSLKQIVENIKRE